jgi:hypothetical protein
MPEQNAVPAPVRTAQRTSSSAASEAIASTSSSRSSIESALRFSGRLRRSSATPSDCETSSAATWRFKH